MVLVVVVVGFWFCCGFQEWDLGRSGRRENATLSALQYYPHQSPTCEPFSYSLTLLALLQRVVLLLP